MNDSAVHFSVDDYLVPLLPHLPSGLFSAHACSNIRSIARHIPGLATFFFGFESPLGIIDARADFLLCFKPTESGREILSGQHDRLHLPNSFFIAPAWQRVQAFCQTWADPNSSLYNKVENTWLEFDIEENQPAIPLPSFFFGTYNAIQAKMPPHQHQWVTGNALKCLFNNTLSIDIQRQLLTCFNALPNEAYVFQVGTMLARNTDAIRICIRNIAPEQVVPYLIDVGWSGSAEELNTIVERLAGVVDRVDLDIDVGASVYPKVGLECYLGLQPQYEPRWAHLLNGLVEKGLCVPEKQKALLAYPGYNHERINTEVWPKQLLKMSALMGPRYLSMLIRSIHHIKIVYQPNTPLQAKAYVAITHHFLDTAAVQTFDPSTLPI